MKIVLNKGYWNLSYSGHDYPVPLMEIPDYKSVLKEK